MKKSISTICSLTFAGVLLAGCAGTGADFRPVVDKAPATYEQDLAQCQDLAKERKYFNMDGIMDTGLGAAGGTAIGAIADGWTGAWIGALIGTGVGFTDHIFQTKDDRKNIVIKCMKNRGYNVLDSMRQRSIF